MLRHERKVAVVTGGATGIGRAIAERLAREGARVAIAGRNKKHLDEAAGEIGARGYRLDVREEQSCRDVMARIAGDLGPISLFVANAGVGGSNEFDAGDRWREIVSTNLDGAYFSIRAALLYFAPAPARRDVIVVSSILGKVGVPGYTAYCATKTGLLGLTRALALELAPKNVMVNAVCPGWVETDMAIQGLQQIADAAGSSLEWARAAALEAVPLRRMSQPGEVASLVSWMASDECAGMTGQSVDLNHGAFLE